jgi:hypothetical protein
MGLGSTCAHFCLNLRFWSLILPVPCLQAGGVLPVQVINHTYARLHLQLISIASRVGCFAALQTKSSSPCSSWLLAEGVMAQLTDPNEEANTDTYSFRVLWESLLGQVRLWNRLLHAVVVAMLLLLLLLRC